MAHTYSHLFNIPTTGLRFFTVYGEWGRPDMATMLFAKAILQGHPIKVFNNGQMSRDFTYVEDIVEGVVRVMQRYHRISDRKDKLYRIYNIGNSQPVNLLEFIETMEEALERKAIKEMLPMQPGDVEHTYADVSKLYEEFGYQPRTSIAEGVGHFVNWYLKYYYKRQSDAILT